MLSVIITENKSKGFIRLDLSTFNLVLQPDLDKATFFSSEFSSELVIILKKARKAFKGYKFRVVTLDDSLVSDSRVLKKHFVDEEEDF